MEVSGLFPYLIFSYWFLFLNFSILWKLFSFLLRSSSKIDSLINLTTKT